MPHPHLPLCFNFTPYVGNLWTSMCQWCWCSPTLHTTACTSCSGILLVEAADSLRSHAEHYTGVRSGIMAEDTAPHEGATPVRGSDITQLLRMSLRPRQDLLLAVTLRCGWPDLKCTQSRQTLPNPSGWKSSCPSLRTNLFVSSPNTGYWKQVTIVQWPGACNSTMRRTETNWSGSTSYRPERRGQENSWPTLQDLCVCSPTGLSYFVCWTAAGNSKRAIYPRNSFLISAALVDARDA